ncbi:MAG: response regulator [Thermodesulfobacteriota bacterium]
MPDHNILLVDPFKNLLNAYRLVLEEEKYAVETASNLRDAYELLTERQYSIIITEYIPPFETTEFMIQWVKEKNPETYIIMVSNAFVDEKNYEKLFATGLDDFILKPYSPDKILVHIKKGLRQRHLIQKLQQLEKLSFLEPFAQEIQEIIFNAIFFKKCLRQELKKAKRHNHSFSLLLLQLPAKQEIGDRFDSFYVQLVKIVRRHTREEDMVGKNNGEIGIILPETDQTGSKVLVQRLLNLIKNHPPFKSDNTLKRYAQNLFFQSFTYPDEFALPESLRAVLEEVDGKSFHLS